MSLTRSMSLIHEKLYQSKSLAKIDLADYLQTAEEIGGRAADPREMGRAVVYFASSDGDYVTGAYLRVDGGFVVGKY